MKVKYNHNNEVFLTAVQPGSAFALRGEVYIRVRTFSDDGANALRVEDGELCSIDGSARVVQFPYSELILQ